jgi:putative ABC transport system permease protein
MSGGLLVGIAGAFLITGSGLDQVGFGAARGSSFTPIFMPSDLLNVWLLSAGLSILAGVYPVWKASKLSPLVALRRD